MPDRTSRVVADGVRARVPFHVSSLPHLLPDPQDPVVGLEFIPIYLPLCEGTSTVLGTPFYSSPTTPQTFTPGYLLKVTRYFTLL